MGYAPSMAQFVVTQRFVDIVREFDAGTVLDSRQYDIDALRRAGCSLVPYSPGEQGDALVAFLAAQKAVGRDSTLSFIDTLTSFGVPPSSSRATYGPDTVIVESADDFPAPNGSGVRHLQDAVYIVRGTVVLPDGERLVCSASTDIIGRLASQDFLTGNVDGPFITYAHDNGGTFRPVELNITNLSTGPSAVSLSFSGVGTNYNSSFVSYFGPVEVGECNSWIYESGFISAPENRAAVRFSGPVRTVAMSSYAAMLSGLNAVGVLFDSGASVSGAYTSSRSVSVFSDASQIGFRQEVGANVVSGNIVRPTAAGASGTLLSGFSETDPNWEITQSPTIPDSATGGGVALGTTITTQAVAQGTYTDLSDGSTSAWATSPNSARVAVADEVTGELEFDGITPARCVVAGGISATRTDGGSPQFELALFYRPNAAGTFTEIPFTARQRDLTARSGAMDILQAVVTLSRGDRLKLMIRNNDGANRATITAASLSLHKIASQ
jgi:hypothetical protein